SGRDQECFLFAGKLAPCPRARLLAERRLQVAEHESALGPVHGGAAHPDIASNLLVAGAGIRRQQNLRPLELARRLPAPSQERGQLLAFGWLEFDAISYIHPCLLVLRHGRTAEIG